MPLVFGIVLGLVCFIVMCILVLIIGDVISRGRQYTNKIKMNVEVNLLEIEIASLERKLGLRKYFK